MWLVISNLIQQYPVTIKICFEDHETDWSTWIRFPVEGYGDISSFGPFRLADAIGIVIDPLEIRQFGKRVRKQQIDHTHEIEVLLHKSGLIWTKDEDGKLHIEGKEKGSGLF